MIDGVLHLCTDPSADLVMQGSAGWPNHEKAIHESVVDRTLEPMTLAERAVVHLFDDFPSISFLAEMGRPRAIGHDGRPFEFLLVDLNENLSHYRARYR